MLTKEQEVQVTVLLLDQSYASTTLNALKYPLEQDNNRLRESELIAD